MVNYQEINLDVTVQGSPLAIDANQIQNVIRDAVKKACGVYEVQVEVKGNKYVTPNKPKEENGK